MDTPSRLLPPSDFLGIYVDAALTFGHHFSEVHTKLLKATYIIRILAKTVPTGSLRSLYFAYYNSHLVYCLPIWFPLLDKKSQNSIYLLQKRLIRTLCNAHFREHCMPLFKKQGILTVTDLLIKENAMFMYRIITRTALVPVTNIFNFSAVTQNTRNTNIIIPRHHLSIVNRSFICKSVMDWQAIPANIRSACSKKALSRNIINYLSEKY